MLDFYRIFIGFFYLKPKTVDFSPQFLDPGWKGGQTDRLPAFGMVWIQNRALKGVVSSVAVIGGNIVWFSCLIPPLFSLYCVESFGEVKEVWSSLDDVHKLINNYFYTTLILEIIKMTTWSNIFGFFSPLPFFKKIKNPK